MHISRHSSGRARRNYINDPIAIPVDVALSSSSARQATCVSRVNQNDVLRVLCVSEDGRLGDVSIQTVARLQSCETACVRADGVRAPGGKQ